LIFVTAGTQLPFPRLLAMVAEVTQASEDTVFAQTAAPEYSGPLPGAPFLERAEFEECCRRAHIIIGHAGTGTIFAARRFGKPLVVVPRRFHLGEHRNDHQTATAHELERAGRAVIAEDAATLARFVANPPPPMDRGDGSERERLVAHLAQLLR
jgi:UDP-N-acetylglucosamine transferase subunit ALG13